VEDCLAILPSPGRRRVGDEVLSSSLPPRYDSTAEINQSLGMRFFLHLYLSPKERAHIEMQALFNAH